MLHKGHLLIAGFGPVKPMRGQYRLLTVSDTAFAEAVFLFS